MPECAQTFWVCLASSLLPFPALPIECHVGKHLGIPLQLGVVTSGSYSFELSHLCQHILSITGSCMKSKFNSKLSHYYGNNCTAPLPPPNDVRPILLVGGNLTFQWSSVAPACSNNLEYRINSVNCGNCVLSSNTSATCYGVPQPMATCSFSVQSVVCGNQIGDFSRPVELMLKGTRIVLMKKLAIGVSI